MEKDRTLYISDLDGTLLNSSAELSEYAVNTLNRLIKNGLQFSVATARTLATAEKILAGVGLRNPIALMNGVLIYDMGLKCFSQVLAICPDSVEAVIRVVKSFENTAFMYELDKGEMMTYHETLELEQHRDFVEERVARYYKSFRHTESLSGVSPEHIVYFTLLDTFDRLRPIRDALSSLTDLSLAFYMDVYHPELWYLEIFSAEASKKNAVMYLRESLEFGHIVGFGDNFNDLPMFEACDECVAVENAKQEVKSAADHVCASNVDDGVVKWIEERISAP